MQKHALFVVAASFVLLFAARARAETWLAPVGGRALPVSGVVCPGGAGAWTIESDGHAVRPPATDDAIGKSSVVHVAPDADKCAAGGATLELVAIGRDPQVDPASVVLAVDDARAELRGHGLKGAVVRWQVGDRSGDDRCVQPTTENGVDKCVVTVGRGMPADPTAPSLSVLPAGARVGQGTLWFDANGARVDPAAYAVRPARVVLATLTPTDVTIDLAGGTASRIPLTHPEAVTSAECGAAACEVSNNVVLVRGLSNIAGTLPVRLRLSPRVYLQRGDTLDNAPSIDVPVLPCGMSIASGDAVRGADDARVVVKIDARCANDAKNLRFFAQGHQADVIDEVENDGAAFVLVRVGRIEGDDLSVTASRSGEGLAIVGAARTKTRALGAPHAILELPGRGPIDFIPTNRPALARFGSPGGAGRLYLLPLEDVYDVWRTGQVTTLEGKRTAAGFVSLRFGYRVESLPGRLATADLAVLVDPVERPMHDANVPAALGASAMSANPLVELDCATDDAGHAAEIKPGELTNIPFAARDSCRLVLHAERLAAEDGAQQMNLEIDVTRVDGTPRPEAHVSQPITLRAAPQPRYAWIKGVTGPFDRVTVRLAHSADESHYVGAAELQTGAPSVQWSVVTGTGNARLYATTAIPTGLYRVADRAHSGILTLNFGVLARFTWLDREGHEGFLGAEAGVMGEGLANDVDASGHSATQVATVTGLGLSVPIANRSLATETSINLHAWVDYEVSRAVSGQDGSPVGFVFGPSISIGNVGTNL